MLGKTCSGGNACALSAMAIPRTHIWGDVCRSVDVTMKNKTV